MTLREDETPNGERMPKWVKVGIATIFIALAVAVWVILVYGWFFWQPTYYMWCDSLADSKQVTQEQYRSGNYSILEFSNLSREKRDTIKLAHDRGRVRVEPENWPGPDQFFINISSSVYRCDYGTGGA